MIKRLLMIKPRLTLIKFKLIQKSNVEPAQYIVVTLTGGKTGDMHLISQQIQNDQSCR
jgi:hypothetical protein